QIAELDRGRYHVADLTAAFPDDLSRRQVVAPYPLAGVGDDLRAAIVLDHEWRRPSAHFVALGSPADFARPRIKREQAPLSFVVAVQDDEIAVQHRGTRLAKAQSRPHRVDGSFP